MKLSFTPFPRYEELLLSPPLNPPLFSSFWTNFSLYRGLPGGSDGKDSACNVRNPGSTPESGSSGEGNGYPFQYSSHSSTETVTGRKTRGLQMEEIACQVSDIFISLKLQEETN